MKDAPYNQFLSIGRKVLPVLVKPLPDELLSSWIMRYSQQLLTKSHTFCKFIYEKENVWNRDIDLNASDKFLQEFASKSFLTFEEVYRTTLRSYSPNLFVDKIQKWIIPIHIYHRTRKGTGLMFCPSCLRKDEIPYFRRKWRLSLSVVCPECGVVLIDECPRCHSPIVFHRLEVGGKETILDKPICQCFNCLFDFRGSVQRKAGENVLEFQNYLYSVLDKGYTERIQYSHLYFEGIHQLAKILDSATSKLRAFDKEVSRRSRGHFALSERRNDFNRKNVTSRLSTIKKICWLLGKWPERLIEVSLRTRTFSSFLLKDMKNPPYWFWKVVMENAYVVFTEWRSDPKLPNLSSYSVIGKKKLNTS